MVMPRYGEYIFRQRAKLLVEAMDADDQVYVPTEEGRSLLALSVGLPNWKAVERLTLAETQSRFDRLCSMEGRSRLCELLLLKHGVELSDLLLHRVCSQDIAHPSSKPCDVKPLLGGDGTACGLLLPGMSWSEHERGIGGLAAQLYSTPSETGGTTGNDLIPGYVIYQEWSTQSPAFVAGEKRAIFRIGRSYEQIPGRRAALDAMADWQGHVPFLSFRAGRPSFTSAPQLLHASWRDDQVLIGATGDGVNQLRDIHNALLSHNLLVAFGPGGADSRGGGLFIVQFNEVGTRGKPLAKDWMSRLTTAPDQSA